MIFTVFNHQTVSCTLILQKILITKFHWCKLCSVCNHCWSDSHPHISDPCRPDRTDNLYLSDIRINILRCLRRPPPSHRTLRQDSEHHKSRFWCKPLPHSALPENIQHLHHNLEDSNPWGRQFHPGTRHLRDPSTGPEFGHIRARDQVIRLLEFR